MAKKNAPKKTPKKQAAQKKAAKPKAAEKKHAVPAPTSDARQPQDDSKEVVVFAMRLRRAERDLIHKAAGSGKASQFIRALALAAAKGDLKSIQVIVSKVRK
ncbi:MAG: hypothetical protein KAY32_15510 [Candidatus Eisenbacteria sp.]|nr:hypothetical protein [Candidatus Eisenbacteria bacterium]